MASSAEEVEQGYKDVWLITNHDSDMKHIFSILSNILWFFCDYLDIKILDFLREGLLDIS
jgi:hypothetical protein